MNKLIKSLAFGVTAVALVISGAISSPANAASPGDQAVITVSKSTGLNGDGETITINGSGFVENGTQTYGTRPPLAGAFGGVYVTFGKFQDSWKPSENAPSGYRKASTSDAERTKWLLPGMTAFMFGGAAAGAFELPVDGNFAITLKVSKELSDSSNNLIFNDVTAGNYGIYTYAGSGALYAPFETFTPISFASEEETVNPTSPGGEEVQSARPTPKLSKKFSREIAFNSGSSKLGLSAKSNIKKKIADYRLASTITITATAGMSSCVSEKTVTKLAKNRAAAIKKYLVQQGISASKIVIKTELVKSGKRPTTKVVATP